MLAGHSAGGQLALWAASRAWLPAGSAWVGGEQPAQAVVSLAGVCDLAACFRLDLADGTAAELLGGRPTQFPERHTATGPMALLPSRLRVRLVHGVADDRVPSEMSLSYAQRAPSAGDDASYDLADCGHSRSLTRRPQPGRACWRPPAQRPLVPLSRPSSSVPRRDAPSCMLAWRGALTSGKLRFAQREPGDGSARPAPLAQSAERLHGKEKVYGSIP